MARAFNPVHAVVQHCQDAQAQQRPLFEDQNPWPGLVAASLAVDLWTLQKFFTAMTRSGEPVDAGRFFLDPSYAYARLAAAHSSSDAELQALSLMLFERYQALDARRAGATARPMAH